MRYCTLKRASVALLLVVLTCIAPRLRRLELPTYPADFNVYYAASMLVRQGQAAQLYRGADTGADPQKALAPTDSALYRVARAQGLTFVGLYVYPPILADLLVPFTALSLPSATRLWLLTNCIFLLLSALLVIRLLRLRFRSWPAALTLLTVFCFTPALQCLVDGQITILLLLLWAAGMVLYQKDQETASAVLFALATAIKLTPALIVLPFLIWRKWRFVGTFVCSLVCLALLSLWVDTPEALQTYIARVLPAMSGSIPYYTNSSLAAATQRLITLLRTGSIAPFPPALPPTTVLWGRVVTTGVLVALFALIARNGRRVSKEGQLMVLGLLSLMAPILSPVSWFHAYTTAFVAFARLWRKLFVRPNGTAYLVALTAASLLLGTAVGENLLPLLLQAGQQTLACLLQLGQLLTAIGVAFYELWTLKERPESPQTGTHDGTEPSHLALPA